MHSHTPLEKENGVFIWKAQHTASAVGVRSSQTLPVKWVKNRLVGAVFIDAAELQTEPVLGYEGRNAPDTP